MSDLPSAVTLTVRLRQAGLRVTPQRLAIYEALASTDTHPTAQALYEQLRGTIPSLSQATVYNTLQTLVEHGLIYDIGEAGDGTIHYDANSAPHVNLVCTRCHRIDDFFEVPLETVTMAVMQESGYQLQGARVAYYGICPRCQGELGDGDEP